ncbi:MAG: hypothetical protein SH819_14595 [Cytophagales bacterium]|nr:hypothetical protein [Cytophagales bacterium]
MKRTASIGFLLLYLVMFTEVREVLRLPILVQHFVEHRAQLPSMSFLQFLAMHYETDAPHDSTDMELPFKDYSNSVTAPAFALINQKVLLSTDLPEQGSVFFAAYFSFVPLSELNEIFQPPRA